MVYLIIGLLLLLLYVFATPESIKGTVNIVPCRLCFRSIADFAHVVSSANLSATDRILYRNRHALPSIL